MVLGHGSWLYVKNASSAWPKGWKPGRKKNINIYILVKNLCFKWFYDSEKLTQDFRVVRVCSAEVYADMWYEHLLMLS